MAKIFENAMRQLDKALKYVDVSSDAKILLKNPKEIFEFGIPVRMDDGKLKVFTGYRVRYNDAIGPTKGGIRFHPDVNLDEIKSLSFWMTFKTSVVGIPYGGGKGGVRVNPRELSKVELERLSRGYIRAVYDFIGPKKDIPAPDVYTNEMIMGWMADEYGIIARRYVPGVITGKPISIGGSLGRNSATAMGAFYVINELVKREGLENKSLSVAVQGFGNAGYNISRLLYENGFKIKGISDSKGGIISDEKGFNPKDIMKIKKRKGMIDGVYCKGSVCDEKKHEHITNEELLESDVDVLIPAAIENQITKANASRIKAKYIVEIANGPTTPDADEILYDKGVFLVPDILANSGGVTVSYFEWVQNNVGERWSLDKVNSKLKEYMVNAFSEVYSLKKKYGIDMRAASYIHAIKGIVGAIEAKGTEEFFRK